MKSKISFGWSGASLVGIEALRLSETWATKDVGERFK